MPTCFSKNENINSDTLNKVCEYLQVQPGEIMEWIPDEEYNKKNLEKEALKHKLLNFKQN